MNNDNQPGAFVPDGFAVENGMPPAPVRKPGGVRRSAKAFALSALLVGGATGAALLGPLSADAASPTASASTAASSTGSSSDSDSSTSTGGATDQSRVACDGDHAGRITQAQADARKADVTQRVTDQVNNGFRGDSH